MPFNYNDFMMNPFSQMGLGILAANRPGASTGQAIGQGLLGGMQNMQKLEDWQQKQQERKQRQEAIAQVAQQYPDIAPMLEAYPNAAPQLMASKFRKPGGYGGNPVYVQDRSTGQVKLAQLADDGGAFMFDANGTPERVDFNKYNLIKPYSMQNFGGYQAPFQPMSGTVGLNYPGSTAPQGTQPPQQSSRGYADPRLLGDDEVLSPNSQYGTGGVRGAIPNTVPPEQTPKHKGAVSQAQTEATDRGAKIAELRERLAMLPGMYKLVDELEALANKATYTLAGQGIDAVVRQLGGTTKGAVARSDYESKIDNEVLPLLRQTFGAQFTENEGKSLKATLGDPDKSPAEKKAVLRSFITTKVRTINSQIRQLQQGIPLEELEEPTFEGSEWEQTRTIDGTRYGKKNGQWYPIQ